MSAHQEASPDDHPRPQLRREQWVDLNGRWEFAFDDGDVGRAEEWERGNARLEREINVPFAWQSRLSGLDVDPDEIHDIVWYRRELPDLSRTGRERLVVHFEAIDYEAHVWVNGTFVGSHRGGQTGFSCDVTDALSASENRLVVRARDHALDPSVPRGKQTWQPVPSGILYTRSTGIHGPVWAEVVDLVHASALRLTPDVDNEAIRIAARLAGSEPGARVVANATIDGRPAGRTELEPDAAGEVAGTIELSELVLWEPAPGRPALYDLVLEVLDGGGTVRDRVRSYFGMRKVEVRDGRLFVNGTERFLRGVLDQRWDRDGLLTPASGESLRRDVELAIDCGFNFVRVHQKREDLRYYAWADRLGLMVTGEAANAFHYTPRYVQRMTGEWTEIVESLFSSPSVIAWLPINESWGCRTLGPDGRGPTGPFHADHASAMYHLTKSLDPTRPCASNDGWEHTRSDFTGVHDYSSAERLREHIAALELPDGVRRLSVGNELPVYLKGCEPPGEAVIYTEFGGLFQGRPAPGIGYAVYLDEEDFHQRFHDLIAVLVSSRNVAGFVYTQWKDVEQETNGLLTADGQLKFDPALIRAAVTQPRPFAG